jgi:hypothetical protein
MNRRHEFIAALIIAVALARDQRRRDRRGSQNASPCGSREMPSLSRRIASGNLCYRVQSRQKGNFSPRGFAVRPHRRLPQLGDFVL